MALWIVLTWILYIVIKNLVFVSNLCLFHSSYLYFLFQEGGSEGLYSSYVLGLAFGGLD